MTKVKKQKKVFKAIYSPDCSCTSTTFLPGGHKPENYSNEQEAITRFIKLDNNAKKKEYQRVFHNGPTPELTDYYFVVHFGKKHIIGYKL